MGLLQSFRSASMRGSMSEKSKPTVVWTGRPAAERTLIILITVYALGFFCLAARCYNVFGRDTEALAQFNSMMWSTLHGRPFYLNCMAFPGQQQLLSNFAIHAAYFWVFLFPIYALAASPYTLLFLQSLFLGLAAVPAYRIARSLLHDDWAAVLLAMAFVLLPPVASQNLNQVQEPSFLPFFLLFAFYYFLQRRFVPFMIWALLSCLNRENVPLAIAMFGFWALCEKRPRQWFIGPAVLGTVYFLLVIYVTMPWFRKGEAWHVASQFANLGSGPVDIAQNIVTRPSVLFDVLCREGNTRYFIFLIQPLGWILPLATPAALVALPDLAANLLSGNGAFRVLAWHYNVLVSCALFVSTVKCLSWLGALQQKSWPGGRPNLVLAATILVLAVAHWFLWLQPSFFAELPQQASLQGAIWCVPSDASVLAPERLLAHFSSRAKFDSLDPLTTLPVYAKSFEYVVVDANERQYGRPLTKQILDPLFSSGEYELVFSQQNVFVFHHKFTRVNELDLSSQK